MAYIASTYKCVGGGGGGGDKKSCFCSGRIRTLVAMATYSFHRLIMRKSEIGISAESLGIFEFLFTFFWGEVFLKKNAHLLYLIISI